MIGPASLRPRSTRRTTADSAPEDPAPTARTRPRRRRRPGPGHTVHEGSGCGQEANQDRGRRPPDRDGPSRRRGPRGGGEELLPRGADVARGRREATETAAGTTSTRLTAVGIRDRSPPAGAVEPAGLGPRSAACRRRQAPGPIRWTARRSDRSDEGPATAITGADRPRRHCPSVSTHVPATGPARLRPWPVRPAPVARRTPPTDRAGPPTHQPGHDHAPPIHPARGAALPEAPNRRRIASRRGTPTTRTT